MIFYNMRYRGPYEYDKFILNIFQYSNMVNDFIFDSSNTSTWQTLYSIQKNVDNLFHSFIDMYGKSDQIYKLLLMNRSENYD